MVIKLTDSYQPHAMSRYTAVTEAVIEVCQQDYRAGRDLGQSIPGMSATDAAIIVAESLEADRLAESPFKVLLSHSPEQLSDWSLAVWAELIFAMTDQMRQQPKTTPEQIQPIKEQAWAVLEHALDSPTASPLLWYEEIYFDVAQEYRRRRDPRAIELIKRGLAHDLHYYEGCNAENFLRDLAETYLWLGELDQGLTILTRLLHYDSANIWTYNLMAITFADFGLVELGLEAIQRGLALLEATGDPERLRQQFLDSLEEMRQSEKRGREAEVAPEIITGLRQALTLDFTTGQQRPINELCRELIPDLDHVPVKKPAVAPDLPTVKTPGHQQRAVSLTGQKPGRNEPCWCGSGKKYKHCHMQLDRMR